MLEYEGSGKTVEKAIEDALLNLKASRDDVDIKILDTGGLFRKSKVLVSISEDCVEKYAKKEKNREVLKDEEPATEKEIVAQEFVVKKPLNAPKIKEEAVVEQKEEVKENKEEVRKVKEEPCNKTEEKQKTNIVKENVSCEDEVLVGKKFLEDFLKTINLDAQIEVNENEEEIFYSIKGENVASLIGYRGECLNSLQFLVSVINGKITRKNKKVRLDIDGYRERRKETLTALAHRICKKVQKTEHATKLEPMSAYERRIIHTIVSEDYPDLESTSKGEEPHRYLIIKLK